MVFMGVHGVMGRFKLYRKLTSKYCSFTWAKFKNKWRLVTTSYDGAQFVYVPPMRFYSMKELPIQGIYFYHDNTPVRIE